MQKSPYRQTNSFKKQINNDLRIFNHPHKEQKKDIIIHKKHTKKAGIFSV